MNIEEGEGERNFFHLRIGLNYSVMNKMYAIGIQVSRYHFINLNPDLSQISDLAVQESKTF